jgi:hypothetical protein
MTPTDSFAGDWLKSVGPALLPVMPDRSVWLTDRTALNSLTPPTLGRPVASGHRRDEFGGGGVRAEINPPADSPAESLVGRPRRGRRAEF